MQYLKNEQYYINRFDLLTIKTCLDVIDFWEKNKYYDFPEGF